MIALSPACSRASRHFADPRTHPIDPPNRQVQLRLTATDASSGIRGVCFTDEDAYCTDYSTARPTDGTPFDFVLKQGPNGLRTVRVTVIDKAGNRIQSTTASITLKHTCTLRINGKAGPSSPPYQYVTSRQVTVDYPDIEGCWEWAKQCFSDASVTSAARCRTWVPQAASTPLTLSSAQGLKTVRVWRRTAGNVDVGSYFEANVFLDLARPSE